MSNYETVDRIHFGREQAENKLQVCHFKSIFVNFRWFNELLFGLRRQFFIFTTLLYLEQNLADKKENGHASAAAIYVTVQ